MAWSHCSALLLGFCTYLAVRIFPLRVLDRTLIHLAGANQTIHQKNADLEKQYCALLEREAALRSTEATLQHRSDQLVEAQLARQNRRLELPLW